MGREDVVLHEVDGLVDGIQLALCLLCLLCFFFFLPLEEFVATQVTAIFKVAALEGIVELWILLWETCCEDGEVAMFYVQNEISFGEGDG